MSRYSEKQRNAEDALFATFGVPILIALVLFALLDLVLPQNVAGFAALAAGAGLFALLWRAAATDYEHREDERRYHKYAERQSHRQRYERERNRAR